MRRLLVSSVLLLSCVKQDPVRAFALPRGTPRAPSAAQVADGDARLSRDVTPLAYAVDLAVDPAKEGFEGEVRIRVKLAAPKTRIVLQARDLEITDAGRARVEAGKNGGIALVFPSPLSAGEHALALKFRGKWSETLGGIYLAGNGERRAAYTQFEAVDARRAFPCFDEPRFKTPWDVTLRVPRDMVAVANTPETGRKREGDRIAVTFARTKPLPTYLVAFAVGRFDVVEGKPFDGVPVRVIAPKGSGAQAKYALSRVEPVLRTLTDYFGRPYPYEKIDLVAVPDFWAGAMENAGLITFRDTILLQDEAKLDGVRRARVENILAHELAHQWFGNLVTMEWWDDIWLNEGFASWMDTKVAMKTMPEMEPLLYDVRNARGVMAVDAKAAARVVRQPVKTGADVLHVFDGITFGKGNAVLRMIEAWTGEEPFRAGVRAYLDEHAWGNATTDDLFAALEKSTGKPVRAVAATFVDRPGTPLLDVKVRCEGDAAVASIAQSRWLPAGSAVPQTGPWRVPACFRLGLRDGSTKTQCFLVEGASSETRLDACPKWVHPNADEAGYYRWSLPQADLLTLLDSNALSAEESAAMPSNLTALLESGRIEGGTWLDAEARFVSSKRRDDVASAVGNIGGARRIADAGADEKTAQDYARFVRRVLGPRAKALGLSAREGEPLDDELLRPTLVEALADWGADPELRKEARAIADRWLADPRSVSARTARLAVPLAALEGDAAFHSRLAARLREVDDLSDRDVLVGALVSFRDPALIEKTLDLAMTDLFRKNELEDALFGPDDREREVVLRWLDTHYEAVVAKGSDEAAVALPRLGSDRCDEKGRDEWKAFFTKERLRTGQERTLAQTLETIDDCIRLRRAARDSIRARLAAAP